MSRISNQPSFLVTTAPRTDMTSFGFASSFKYVWILGRDCDRRAKKKLGETHVEIVNLPSHQPIVNNGRWSVVGIR